MKKMLVAASLFLSMILPAAITLAGDSKNQKQSENVKVSAKELAEIKRQMRLMRSEMADLEEKIDEITSNHDAVYTDEKPSTEEPKESSSSY